MERADQAAVKHLNGATFACEHKNRVGTFFALGKVLYHWLRHHDMTVKRRRSPLPMPHNRVYHYPLVPVDSLLYSNQLHMTVC